MASCHARCLTGIKRCSEENRLLYQWFAQGSSTGVAVDVKRWRSQAHDVRGRAVRVASGGSAPAMPYCKRSGWPAARPAAYLEQQQAGLAVAGATVSRWPTAAFQGDYMDLNPNEFYAALINGINAHVLGKKTDSYDILTFANIHAAFESARYFNQHMSKARNFDTDLDLLTHAMSIRREGGQILEFGVASGRTINHMATLTSQKLYGFDVFTGLPETWRPGFPQGAFGRADLPVVSPNVELVVGLFENTLDGFLRFNQAPVSLLHVDCDLYAGTRVIFDKLGHLIGPGTVIVFDEYFNYPGWEQHEYKAFQEFVAARGIRYRYEGFVSRHQQVCVVVE